MEFEQNIKCTCNKNLFFVGTPSLYNLGIRGYMYCKNRRCDDYLVHKKVFLN